MNKFSISKPVRKPNRMSSKNYSQPGCYFLTMCTHHDQYHFGTTHRDCIELTSAGIMVTDWWNKLPGKFNRVKLGEFVVMPNHFHGIIIIVGEDPRVLPYDGMQDEGMREDPRVLPYGGIPDGQMQADPYIPRMVQWFKTMSTNEFYRMQKESAVAKYPKLWHRSYWDHIIRCKADYDRIADYIKKNPARWISTEGRVV
jgi:putative transposase